MKLKRPSKRCLAARGAAATMRDERWPHGVCATARASASQGIPQVREPLRRGTLREKLLLLGSVFGYGLRAIDLSRESAGHRNLLARGGRQTLSLGFSNQCGALDAGGRQRVARLENFCRLRANADSHGARALCPRSDGRRSGTESVRAGFDHHRFVSGVVSVGALSATQAAVKMHTLLDLRGNIPAFVHVTDGTVHDVNVLDESCRKLAPST